MSDSEVITVAVVGASFAGLAVLKSIIRQYKQVFLHWQKTGEPYKLGRIQVYLIDPKRGFINTFAIPRAITNVEIAALTYASLDDLNLPYSVYSTEANTVKREDYDTDDAYNEAVKIDQLLQDRIEVRFIQGTVLEVYEHHLLIDDMEGDEIDLPFNYCVYVPGKKRLWPLNPEGFTKSSFMEEIYQAFTCIANSQYVTIAGGGIIGCQVATEVKARFPDKSVTLLHSGHAIPSLSNRFNKEDDGELPTTELQVQALQKLKEMGIDVRLNSRALREVEIPDDKGRIRRYVLTKDQSHVRSDITLWCCKNEPITYPLLSTSLKEAVSPTDGSVLLNECCQVEGFPSVYSLGDVSNLQTMMNEKQLDLSLETIFGLVISSEIVSTNIIKSIVNAQNPSLDKKKLVRIEEVAAVAERVLGKDLCSAQHNEVVLSLGPEHCISQSVGVYKDETGHLRLKEGAVATDKPDVLELLKDMNTKRVGKLLNINFYDSDYQFKDTAPSPGTDNVSKNSDESSKKGSSVHLDNESNTDDINLEKGIGLLNQLDNLELADSDDDSKQS
ncbi:Hypothetical protein PP7435_CHR2-0539 [Komagataella phaffii CBS 7435]|uniref:FAD/NAD(P)-binding domain-containing protein n=2 Tax=Komagataella phaffii TaxID=460519 RepID=C4R1L3_KOMPG|nr:Hypothetical protein PAS_chr2-1_0737 [Komagataella phaffii GS115]AOA62801.1 GQ67_00804T0 [Komagataella phaffii]CAH2448081.1 Hypothetical protein BQ9382_C2-2945 [Komagataella phaffii CBS 7435]AOA67682.1 GQ68_00585T0 [Komagataella phaffii GS115]CAY69387.1 Hypothetical protein PAS_chr2-1_0737 [Komagataella phaffii GS115]CCA38226.1 Hypothetical protein PP7435_CHR2-0539 [Komagataella phaffii CBS 7435]